MLCPSRGRTEKLKESVGSLILLADEPELVEVLVAADPDDDGTHEAVREMGVDLWVAPERAGYARLHEYYNALARRASGEILMLWNDDAMMTTPGWDSAVCAVAADALVIDIKSNLSPEFVAFPGMRRGLYEALGYFTLPTCHVDSYVWQVGRMLERMGVAEAFIQHNRPDLVGGPMDETYREGRHGLNHGHFFSREFQDQIAADVERLRGLV